MNDDQLHQAVQLLQQQQQDRNEQEQERRQQQLRVKSLLTEAVTLLCRSALTFRSDFTVEGLLGITIDSSEVFLVSVHETVLASSTDGSCTVPSFTNPVVNEMTTKSNADTIPSNETLLSTDQLSLQPDGAMLPMGADDKGQNILLTFGGVYPATQQTIGAQMEGGITSDKLTTGNPRGDVLLAANQPGGESGQNTVQASMSTRSESGTKQRKRRRKEMGVENSVSLNLAEMPVIVGMGDLPGMSYMQNIGSISDQLDMSDMTSAYFDDVVVDESHNALFSNVELDDIISKGSQSKYGSVELDDIIDKTSQTKDGTGSPEGGVSSFSPSSFVKREQILLPSDSDESCEASTNYCSQSGDVLLSGVSRHVIGSPSTWDPATDDSLGGGDMAPLNLAGPQDLTTELGKQRHACQLCGKHCKTESRLKKHKCKTDKDMPEPLNLIRQPLDLTVGRLDGSDPAAYLYADLTGEGFACVCSRTFVDYIGYAQHATACSKAHLTPYKSCETCGKFFFSNSGYVKHKKLHVGEYKFRCNVCHKGFFDRTHLRAHTDSTHNKVRRYSCARCAKSFFWKHHLKRHHANCSGSSSSATTATVVADGEYGEEEDGEELEELERACNSGGIEAMEGGGANVSVADVDLVELLDGPTDGNMEM